jgi:hypothetical protein
MFNTRSLVIVLIIFNVIAVGLAEVQRRALVEATAAAQTAATAKLDRSIVDIDSHSLQTLSQIKTSVDDATRILSTRVDALLILYGIRLDQPQEDPAKRDALRGYHVTLLKSALASYHRDHKSYPDLPGNSVTSLAPALVNGRYIDAIPSDPSSRPYQYTTAGAVDGQRYGLKVTLENGTDCLTGVGAENRGWWGTLPMCPF